MGFLDRIFGSVDDTAPAPRREVADDDQRAIERYRYLLRTAPPETIEEVHREAFARLTDDQRAIIYEELSKGAGTGERPLSGEQGYQCAGSDNCQTAAVIALQSLATTAGESRNAAPH